MRRVAAWEIGRAVTQFMNYPPYVAWSLSGLPGFAIRKFVRKTSV